MSKKRSASEIHDKRLPGFKVTKDGVQRAEVNDRDSAIQYEDPWEDEFDSEEEQDNGDQTEHSDDDKSSLPY
jgi:ribosome assembly protein RRB1